MGQVGSCDRAPATRATALLPTSRSGRLSALAITWRNGCLEAGAVGLKVDHVDVGDVTYKVVGSGVDPPPAYDGGDA